MEVKLSVDNDGTRKLWKLDTALTWDREGQEWKGDKLPIAVEDDMHTEYIVEEASNTPTPGTIVGVTVTDAQTQYVENLLDKAENLTNRIRRTVRDGKATPWSYQRAERMAGEGLKFTAQKLEHALRKLDEQNN